MAELVDEEEEDAAVEAVAWGPDDGVPQLWLTHGTTSGLHICLRAESRVEVETFYQAGVAHGGTSQAAPRRWTPYRRGEYGATVRDPDGNSIEVVAPE